jgi:hypothetical protein
LGDDRSRCGLPHYRLLVSGADRAGAEPYGNKKREDAESMERPAGPISGDKDWRTRWYRGKAEEGLFGTIESVEKVADIGLIEDDFQLWLGKAFPFVAKNRMQLKDQGRVLFTLMFACSNLSPKAQGLASKITNHLLKG